MAGQVRTEPLTTEPLTTELAASLPLPNQDYVQVGDRMFRQERWHEASQQYEQAIAQQPAAVPLRCKLGKTLLKQSRWDEAEQQFQKALALNTESHLAHYGVAEVAIARKDWPIAAEKLRRVIALAPGFIAKAYLDLAQVQQQLQRWEDAIAACCAALAHDPADEGYDRLAAVLCERTIHDPYRPMQNLAGHKPG